MWWHVRQDFISLFNCDENDMGHFPAIHGLRAISNILIILCHLITIYGALVPAYPNIEWQQYLGSVAFACSPLTVFALEIFFMLSGFLLTHKLIVQWDCHPKSYNLFLKQYPMSILKRALRFWPGMMLSTIIMCILGEPKYPNSTFFLESLRLSSVWMFFQNYFDMEYYLFVMAPLWSISLDMQVHIILPLIIYFFYSYKKHISLYYSLGILLILSVLYGFITFNPTTMPLNSILRRYTYLSLIVPPHVSQWFESHYNITLPYELLHPSPLKMFLNKMYFPLEARFGSFIIGAILAIKFINSLHHAGESSKMKYFFFFLTFIYMSLLITGGDNIENIPDYGLKLAMAITRQVFAIGQAFLLFTALCSTSHPYHSLWLNRFLSLRIWIPISKLSYSVYVTHWPISFQLIFGGPLLFLRAYSITYSILISLPIVLFIPQVISSVWYVLVEKPIQRVIDYYLNEKRSLKTHAK